MFLFAATLDCEGAHEGETSHPLLNWFTATFPDLLWVSSKK